MNETELANFHKKVGLANGCWEWTGHRNNANYGVVKIRRKDVLAHRASYEHYVGPIENGLELDHLCMNTACVNPKHLEAVTRPENMRRRYATMTHCANGHEFTEENTYRRPDGFRDCRACTRDRVRRYKQRKKGAA